MLTSTNIFLLPLLALAAFNALAERSLGSLALFVAVLVAGLWLG